MNSDRIVNHATDSPYARQLRNKYKGLRFEAPLETLFRERYCTNNLAKLRWSVCIAIFLFILFAIVDAYLLPSTVALWGAGIRLVVVLMLFLNLVATYLPNFRDSMQLITVTSCVVAGVSVILIVYIAQYYGADIPFTGMLLIVSVFYFLSGLLYRLALFAGVATFFVYIVLGLLFKSTAMEIIYNGSFLLAANLIGCVGCYSYEYAARTNFLVHSMLNEMAERDSLTGLYNRRAFDAYLDNLWRSATRQQTSIVIAMIDVDNFKQYNDYYGHQMGDEALKAIAKVLKGSFQRSTDLIARYGGEEFIGVLGDISVDDAKDILEKIRYDVESVLSLPHAEGLQHKVVTVSIGFTYVVPKLAQSLSEQIAQSDSALYLAKARGRNRVVTA